MSTGTLMGSLIFAGVLVVLIAFLIQLMTRGWRRRAERQAALIGELPPLPDSIGSAIVAPTRGMYVGSTLVPDWHDRIVTGYLAYRSKAVLTRYPGGILLMRSGLGPIWIPESAIIAIRTERAIAGKVLTHQGILAIRWRMPSGAEIDTGFLADERGEYDRWLPEES
jgi:hypothetical protein